MNTPAASPNVEPIVRGAVRFLNPFERDDPPPNRPVSLYRRRACGATGAFVAMAAVASLNVAALDTTTPWHIGIYGVIVVSLIGAGTSMGLILTNRAAYKVFFGVMFATMIAVLVMRTILTGIAAVW